MKSYKFPPLYESWIEQFIGKIPDESRATCNDCPMCKVQEPAAMKDRVFLSSTKCCTYNPILPNFLIGGILLDEDSAFAEGKMLFEQGALKQSISPSGVEPSWLYWLRYQEAPFGQALQLRCPYYINREGGLCSIWKYRNSRCTTWFCKYERGVFGLHFWQTLSDLLASIEKGLSKWCIRKLNLTIPDIPENLVQKIWGNWAGKEREFFRNCYTLVSPLSWERLLEISGPESKLLAEKATEKFKKMMDDSIPEKLKTGNFTFEELENHNVRVWGFNSNDSMDLSSETFDRIKNFDGTREDIEDSVVRRLYELKILEECRQDACDP